MLLSGLIWSRRVLALWQLLAMLVADQWIQNNPCVRTPNGELTSDPDIIFYTLLNYYIKLYAPIPAYNVDALEELLADLCIPHIVDGGR